MKQFWSTVLGSFVGMWIALMLFTVFSIVMGIAFLGSMSDFGSNNASKSVIEDQSVLHLNLYGSIDERSTDNAKIMAFLNDMPTPNSLTDILNAIEVASTDNRIKGIFIECNGTTAGMASLHEIRNALLKFKKDSNKFIYAYGDNIAEADYYVASAADSIYINKIGVVDIHGIGGYNLFFKKLLDKLGIEMQVIRVGTFKSAVEPYILTEMSEANRLQTEHYLNNIWGVLCQGISESRNISIDKINMLADSITWLQNTEYILANRLADEACYKNEFEKRLKAALYGDENGDKEICFVEPYELATGSITTGNTDKIAVIYAVGEIDGSTDSGIISSELSEKILEIANDEDIKGVVLRINSPGGSAFGAEQIWAALEEVKKAGKPLAASMGDMAASGGYYIACGADRIFAEPTTLTGSIGVFGVIPCIETLVEDKIGITQSIVKTNENTEFPLISQKMTPMQRASMQRMVNETYELFVARCATGRHTTCDSIKSIAEGRVWDGISAKEIGLVDEFGNTQAAIKWVANQAGISDYDIITGPDENFKLSNYIFQYMETRVENRLESEANPLYKYHKEITKILSRDPIQCLMEPLEIR